MDSKRNIATYMTLIDLVDNISCNFDENIYCRCISRSLRSFRHNRSHDLKKKSVYVVRGYACLKSQFMLYEVMPA